MGFKIGKADLKFALDLCAKALADRDQEEMIYRSVRIQTFEEAGKHYVALSSNGGFNAIATCGYPIEDWDGDIDVLVECQKLVNVISKATVDFIKFKKLDSEKLLVKANGENKLSFLSSDIMAEFAEFDQEKSIGSMKVKNFVKLCRLATPFSVDDIHKAPLIGLCIDNDNLYATDEKKGHTLLKIGLNLPMQLNFNPVASEMVKVFDGESIINFYLGKMSSADSYTHLIMIVDGVRMFVLKYQTQYPSHIMQQINQRCATNQSSITFSKSSALQVLSRLSIFVDDNDILGVTPIKDNVILEVIDLKHNEESKEILPVKLKVEESLMEHRICISLKDFKVILETLDCEEVTVNFGSGHFLSIVDDSSVCWFVPKNIKS
jgi:hypothetical protein